ncbi:rhodanese-like domain-containing protein [Caldalkalibacillus salinus]|uniref:rhodanese-like domain-containing protein n=1 Tax=Caldalkalibacillus salinus TaxID=2803787 RepID=UPI001922143F|nr:rhodanese-like domain-containing protein [Caldalkalibacillus salinus]
MAFEMDGVKQLDTEEVKEVFENKEKDTVLLDVRENEEYNEAHIPGVKLIPTSAFMHRYEQELDKDKNYVVVCRSGNRSQIVCQFLQDQGFKELANYAGGMLEWDGPTDTADLPTDDGQRWR